MPELPSLSPVANRPVSIVLLQDSSSTEELGPVVEQWLHWLQTQSYAWELLLVVHRQAVVPEQARVRLVQVADAGEGALLRAGLAEAQYPLIFYTLAQGQYRPEDLGRLMSQTVIIEGKPHPERVIDHVHLLSGCRAGVPVPMWLRALGWLWRGLSLIFFGSRAEPLPGWLGWGRYLAGRAVWFFLGLRLVDPACPFRLFRREILARIPLQSSSAFAHVELVAKANFLTCLMGEEMPLDVRPGPWRGDTAAIWKDAVQVFRRPDFGPVHAPGVEAVPANSGLH